MGPYEIIVLRYADATPPPTWRAMPLEYTEIARPITGLTRRLAEAWVEAFNLAEQARPCHVWAIVRRVDQARAAGADPSDVEIELTGGPADAEAALSHPIELEPTAGQSDLLTSTLHNEPAH
jgi:hypothetical protein